MRSQARTTQVLLQDDLRKRPVGHGRAATLAAPIRRSGGVGQVTHAEQQVVCRIGMGPAWPPRVGLAIGLADDRQHASGRLVASAVGQARPSPPDELADLCNELAGDRHARSTCRAPPMAPCAMSALGMVRCMGTAARTSLAHWASRTGAGVPPAASCMAAARCMIASKCSSCTRTFAPVNASAHASLMAATISVFVF
jgi:hypothetical protein